jgi:allantoicase
MTEVANINTQDFTALADLASDRLGGRATATSDDFFAPMSGLIKAGPPVFVPGKYTSRGKWMDGWESRRRRTPGHDWCVVALGMRGVIHGVNVDTSFYTGNYPSECSIDALDATGTVTKKLAATTGTPWVTILSRTALKGDHHNLIPIESTRPWTHVRLNIFPDGGVARLRVHGAAAIDWAHVARMKRTVDLASILNGGLVLGANDVHYGAPGNMIMPGRAKNMSDGWETRRRRGPGHDWAIIRLGAPGIVRKIEIDTNHFKGNYPGSASIDACLEPGAGLAQAEHASWMPLLPRTTLRAHHRHLLAKELVKSGPVSHLRLNIYPDGGISRLRVYGTVAHA